MQDNDPKHTYCKPAKFMAEKGANSSKTPPESPNINPNESSCHKLIVYYKIDKTNVKGPMLKGRLINGIEDFWKTVTSAKCTTYIRLLHIVILKITKKVL